MNRKVLKHVAVGLGTIAAGITAFAANSGGLINANRGKIDEFLGTVSSKYVNDDVKPGTDLYNYRPEKSITVDGKTFDCTTAQGIYDYSVNVSERLAAEGQALLKNKANALPLAKSSAVTMLGFRSYKSIFGGDMGSVPVYSEATNFSEAMKQQGFSVNETVSQKYEEHWTNVGYKETESKGKVTVHTWEEAQPGGDFCNVGAGFGAVTGATLSGFNFYEPSSADLGLPAQNKAGVAIVTVGRPAREAGYYLPGAKGKREADPKHNSTWDEDTDILGLCEQERDIIKYAKTNFEKVIVVVNTSSAMDIPELFENNGEYEADAVLWAGLPGAYGFKQTAKILDGTINPSGGLSDTYEAKSSATATGVNVGYFEFKDDDVLDKVRTGSEKSSWYEAETEGIYSGYKYDETRYFDILKNPSSNASKVHTGTQRDTAKLGATTWKYEENVVRSFGYGLSYTDFSEKITNIAVDTNAKTFTATVEVKNEGTVAGKDNVQLYVSLPYSAGNVQKSAIQLAGFGKTKLLNAGASETLTITVRFQDIASWDENLEHDNVKGAYLLDSGDYYFAVGNGAHNAMNNVLNKMGQASGDLITEDGVADSGIADSMAYKVGLARTEITRSLNNTILKNQLQDMDPTKQWNDLQMLDRSHWDTTFPKRNENLASTAAMAAGLRCKNYTLNENNAETVVWGKKTDVTWLSAKPAKGEYVDYGSEALTELVQAITLEDALFVAQSAGGNGIDEIKSINAPEYVCNDGPAGFDGNAGRNLLSDDANPTNTEYDTPADSAPGNIAMRPLPDEVIIGGTFNHELVKEAGEMIGQIAIWVGVSGIYGPGSNIHRTPYNTRNHEYYSEDPIVLGQLTDDYCVGGQKYGLNMYPKHYAFNDYDLNRSGIAPFLCEQDARENALRGFQFAFESNHARGAMGAFGRAGAAFCNAHVGLQTGIAREEWGWKGYMVTDMVNPAYYMNFVDTMWGGADGMLTTANDGTYATNPDQWIDPNNAEKVALVKKDNAFQVKLQTSMRRLLWAELNSNLMNGKAGAGHTEYYRTWYDNLITGLVVGGSVIIGLSAAGFLALTFVPKKKDN